MTSHLLSLHTCAVLQMPIHERKREKERKKEGGKENEGGKKEGKKEREREINQAVLYVFKFMVIVLLTSLGIIPNVQLPGAFEIQ